MLATALAWLLAATGLVTPAVPANSPSLLPIPVGPGQRYRPPAVAPDGRPRAGMPCQAQDGTRFPVHLELFAAGRVVIVPAGIGIAPPLERSGAYVSGGSCRYPLATVEPTGLIWVLNGEPRTLGDLFAVWDRRLGPGRMLGFRGRVGVTIDGAAYTGDPRSAPLRERSQIVVQVGRAVPPHPAYRFPDER
jgi:hypothetical protein